MHLFEYVCHPASHLVSFTELELHCFLATTIAQFRFQFLLFQKSASHHPCYSLEVLQSVLTRVHDLIFLDSKLIQFCG